ncbi:MAG TPA: phage tail sheath subtilisin-like domain-containing protein, partial [Saprospiraceae bacterium]|nr:phage tail sheath subtilisin-like domain-containing protein [Saprospiraceae bacterium]
KERITSSVTGHNDGIREKWAIIANAINAYKANNPDFRWTAQLWGSRLALLPGDGADNSVGTLTTSGGIDIGTYFIKNVRYYSLGIAVPGDFQSSVVSTDIGNDGYEPKLSHYNAAFPILDKEVDLFNLMILPHDADHDANTTATLWGPASVFCQQRRAFLLMDPPESWANVQNATDPNNGVNSLRIGLVKDHSAVFYPRVTVRENGLNVQVGPSGAIAGLMARTDGNRGVWKAPAGTEADLRGVNGLEYRFSDRENGVLNPQGINTLRIFPNGIVNWGARTMDGDDDFGSEYKYIPIRRTALFIEESLYRGLKWVVFEPNDEPLWSQIRLNVGAFMHNLFRQGAFQGQKKNDAYFVKCDAETTTQNDINLGIVNVWVGFAPLKPAEFVILYLQQMTGQIQV